MIANCTVSARMAALKTRQIIASQAKRPAEVVADGGENGVDGVAAGMGEVVSAHAVLVFGMADDGFDGRAPAQFAA